MDLWGSLRDSQEIQTDARRSCSAPSFVGSLTPLLTPIKDNALQAYDADAEPVHFDCDDSLTRPRENTVGLLNRETSSSLCQSHRPVPLGNPTLCRTEPNSSHLNGVWLESIRAVPVSPLDRPQANHECVAVRSQGPVCIGVFYTAILLAAPD